ncbi:MAG: FtsX-like permease family protein, partial [Bacteroidota bacterium]
LLSRFIAGIFPAFFVSRIAILKSINGGISDPGIAMSLRIGLMVVQFMISIVLISGSLIVYDQLGLMRNKPLGFQKELMVTAPIQSNNFNAVFGGVDQVLRKKLETFESTIGQLSAVKGSSLSSGLLGFGMVNRNIIPEGFTAEDNVIAPSISVDHDFLEIYEIPLVSGRYFDESYSTDKVSAFIINETAVSAWEFGDPQAAVGKTINLEGKEGKVIGVVTDFHFLSLSEAMRPMVIDVADRGLAYLTVKLTGQNLTESLVQIEKVWNEIFPAETFDPQFLDEALAQTYIAQEQFGKLVGYFAFMAVLISCMGSYGLIMFIASEKRKEVGVRKVLGASVNQLVFLLAKRFVILVLIAILVAVPIVIYFAQQWLGDFSNRVGVSPLSIASAALLTMALVFGTVSIQAFLAARANPVKSLRSE